MTDLISNVSDRESSDKKFLSFNVADILCGIDADKVRAVVAAGMISPLPNASDSLMGITTVKGEIVAVVDLKHLLDLGVSKVVPKSKLILLRSVVGETQIAILVDKLNEFVVATPTPIPASAGSPNGITAMIETPDGPLFTIDRDVVFRSLTLS